jgi:hypothetical protein
MREPLYIIKDNKELYWCNFCKQRLAKTEFLESALQVGRRQCRRCNIIRTQKYRKENPFACLLANLRQRERKKGNIISRLVQPSDIEALFQHSHYKKDVINTYRLVRKVEDEPWSLDNCEIVCKKSIKLKQWK